MCACRHGLYSRTVPKRTVYNTRAPLHICTHTAVHTTAWRRRNPFVVFCRHSFNLCFSPSLKSDISVHDQLKHLVAESLSTVRLLRGPQRQKLCIPSRIFTANDVPQPRSLSRRIRTQKSNDSQLRSVRHLKQKRQRNL